MDTDSSAVGADPVECPPRFECLQGDTIRKSSHRPNFRSDFESQLKGRVAVRTVGGSATPLEGTPVVL